MKKTILFICLMVVYCTTWAQTDNKFPEVRFWGSVAIGKNSFTSPDASAYLDVGPNAGGNKGLLLRPVTSLNAIELPVMGLFAFNAADSMLYSYNGLNWQRYLKMSDTSLIKSIVMRYAPSVDTSRLVSSVNSVLPVSGNVHLTLQNITAGGGVPNQTSSGIVITGQEIPTNTDALVLVFDSDRGRGIIKYDDGVTVHSSINLNSGSIGLSADGSPEVEMRLSELTQSRVALWPDGNGRIAYDTSTYVPPQTDENYGGALYKTSYSLGRLFTDTYGLPDFGFNFTLDYGGGQKVIMNNSVGNGIFMVSGKNSTTPGAILYLDSGNKQRRFSVSGTNGFEFVGDKAIYRNGQPSPSAYIAGDSIATGTSNQYFWPKLPGTLATQEYVALNASVPTLQAVTGKDSTTTHALTLTGSQLYLSGASLKIQQAGKKIVTIIGPSVGGLGITDTLPSSSGTFALRQDLSGYASSTANFNSQAGTSYILQAGDNGKVIDFSSSAAIILTIPSGLPTGFNCLIHQSGTGQVTFSASGTTIHNRQGYTQTAGQYSIGTILCTATNTFTISGDLQ